MAIQDPITPFGIINFRNQQKEFGIKLDDRRRHMYVIGKTGMGKSTLLENMIISDIANGKGVGVVDPHGELAEKILEFVPEHRMQDVMYFNPSDTEYPVAFNPLEQVGTEYRHLVASGIMGVFKKIWVDLWSARMEYILNNTLLALLEYPGSTLLGVMRMLNDKEYRKKVVDNLKDPVVKSFWVNEFAQWSQKFETEATAAIQNKVGQLVTNPLIRNILGQSRSSVNLRKAMDEQKILIFNLSKGRIGEDNSALIGSMIITKLQLAAMSRVDIPEHQRRDFYLYVDEFQNFATDSFANILSEARKYRLCLVLAHQYIRQLVHDTNTKVKDAIFGNVGTLLSFRVGAEDAEELEKEFQPDFMANDFVGLPKYNFYTKLMIDGIASRPFSASTIPPHPKPEPSFSDMIIENSRKTYGTPRKTVEEIIAGEWMGGREAEAKERKPSRKGEVPLAKVLRREEGQGPSGSLRGGGQSAPARPGSARPWREGERGMSAPAGGRPAGRPVWRGEERREAPLRKKEEPSHPQMPVHPERPRAPRLSELPSRPEKPAQPAHREARQEKPTKKVNIKDLRAALEKSLMAQQSSKEDEEQNK